MARSSNHAKIAGELTDLLGMLLNWQTSGMLEAIRVVANDSMVPVVAEKIGPDYKLMLDEKVKLVLKMSEEGFTSFT